MVNSDPLAPLDGRDAVAQLAPTAAVVLDRLEATAWTALDAAVLAPTAAAIAAVHGVESPTSETPTSETPPALDPRALAFAEQFALDVSALAPDTRDAMVAAMGDAAFTFTQVVYVFDVVGRTRLVLDGLFGVSAPAGSSAAGVDPFSDVWAGVEALIAAVPGLDALDPVTSELVRLRLARHHNCRLCRSLRSYAALEAGADDATFDAAADPSDPRVDDATRAALTLVDAFAWSPTRLDDALTAALGRHFSAAQQVEIVLDTARNAANKIAVALGADAPHVDEGYEVYAVAPDGTMTYGLEHPTATSDRVP